MGIVISILKTVGIILLIILAVLLLVLCMVLFVPVRYRARGEIPAEGKPHGIVRLTWFFSFISYSLEYDSGKYEKNYLSQLKICGFRFRVMQKVPKTAADERKPVSGGDNAGKQAEEDKKPKSDKKPQNDKQTENEGRPSEEAVQKIQKLSEKDGDGAQSTEGGEYGSRKDGEQKGVETGEKNQEEESGEKPGMEPDKKPDEKEAASEKAFWWVRLRDILSSFFRAVKEAFQNIQYTINKLCDKIKQSRDNIDYYIEVLTLDETQLVLKNVHGEAGRLLRHLGPRKMKVDFIVGTGDPASTGQILAIYGILYPIIGETVHISPDFDNPRLEGEFDIRGRVRFVVVLAAVLRIILDKKTWRFVRRLKKEEMTNGRKK